MPHTAPAVKPANPNFSSGPCSKRPGWTVEALAHALVGRSHRSKPGKVRIQRAIELTRELLEVPKDYLIGIVPASDTGAVEMALWSMLGERGVDMLAWESFGAGWVTDVVKQLKLEDARIIKAPYGELPDLGEVDCDRDVVFTWNGTTSGVRVPNADWIAADRKGLTFCDATSAAFAQKLDFPKLDVVTFSWQKALGGEAAHGVLILSPRAVARLESYKPERPLPKIFRLTKGDKLLAEVFDGATINTPSMLCIEDAIDAMEWGLQQGGLTGLQARADANFKVLADWVAKTEWVEFLAKDEVNRSNTSVCFSIVDPAVAALPDDKQAAFAKAMVARLDKAGAAYDIGAYKDAPSGLRIWAGSTIEADDLLVLTPWLDFAFAAEKLALTADAA
ncbi:phosphoserine transaminase [Devosia rhodophyticola]|uniref:phosphoserine transaminase n=1 Tax=Devosia rhodophyticola TaxID=3026423 RepID=A0ABY7Z246_9HYPH|nr:phosphoserine transaminase [Devosia rhodophyticola]WDR07534.1 phosphoserine transaminase [Devosia rhodophyticola]